ncbi:hypothetical protein [Haloferula sp. A504]|uniref:hypothetical protein n=1 Tax=Haloferula sp. A504 TaxID=3373601 RepID=UPI0031BFD2CC|nr:hypothetical protein [Verrucomicrobiaceae bacterium E54]
MNGTREKTVTKAYSDAKKADGKDAPKPDTRTETERILAGGSYLIIVALILSLYYVASAGWWFGSVVPWIYEDTNAWKESGNMRYRYGHQGFAALVLSLGAILIWALGPLIFLISMVEAMATDDSRSYRDVKLFLSSWIRRFLIFPGIVVLFIWFSYELAY